MEKVELKGRIFEALRYQWSTEKANRAEKHLLGMGHTTEDVESYGFAPDDVNWLPTFLRSKDITTAELESTLWFTGLDASEFKYTGPLMPIYRGDEIIDFAMLWVPVDEDDIPF